MQREILNILRANGEASANEMVSVVFNADLSTEVEGYKNDIAAWHANRSAITRSLRKLVSEGIIERVGKRTEDGYCYRLTVANG